MGDDNSRIGHESGDGIAIDFMAGCHFVGNAVKLDGFFRDRSAGLVERTKRIEHSRDAAVGMIGKLDHAQFNHLIRGGI
jgi:hypothetical protein